MTIFPKGKMCPSFQAMFCGFAAGKISSDSEKNKTRNLKIFDFQI